MSSSRVRPAIRRGAIVALIVLLPVAAHSVWDYVEIQRLVGEIEAIQTKGEPVRPSDVRDDYEPRGDGNGPFAGSHYLAAAVLVSPDHASAVGVALNSVRASLEGTPAGRLDWQAALEQAQEVVRRHNAALTLADRAAALEFRGFPIDTEYSYRAADLSAVSRMISVRTIGLARAGDGDRAIDSALSAIQMRRALEHGLVPFQGSHETAAILSLVAPSTEALLRLDAALAAEDRPAERTRWFLQQRAVYVDTFWRRYYGTDPAAPSVHLLRPRSVGETVFRPWFTHRFVEMLQVWDELTAAVRAPAPRNAELGVEIERQHSASNRSNVRQRSFFLLTQSESLVNLPLFVFREALRVDDLAIDRASRVAVAVERYRRDHAGDVPGALTELVPQYLPSLPVDPATGGALLYRRSEQDYTVYSVGADRTDDGGVLLRVTPASRGSVASARRPDVGVRVLIRR